MFYGGGNGHLLPRTLYLLRIVVSYLDGQQLEWAAVDAALGRGEPLQGVVGLATVGGAGVEDDAAVQRPRLGVPEDEKSFLSVE